MNRPSRVCEVVRTGSVLAIVAVLVAGAAGCGNKGEKEIKIADPVAEALAHAPADAALLAVVATDAGGGPGQAAARLAGRFGGGALLVGQAQATLGGRIGLDYEEELRPLLAHPVVAWSPDGSAARRFAAWVVRDGERLGELLAARVKTGALKEVPARDGDGDTARYTRRGGGAYARRGPLLVSAPDLASLDEVLRRRAARRGQWSRALLRERDLGLPEPGAVARFTLDARALVARADPALTRIRWVAGLRRAVLTVTPEAGGLRVRARASTVGLGAADLPIATGVAPPRTRGTGRLVAAVRGPRQALAFARAVTDLLDPERLAGLRRAEDALGRYARVSVQKDLLDRLTGTATLTSPDGRRLTLRADLDDPGRTVDALERVGALARFGGPLAELAGVDLGGLAVEESDGRYAITQDGRLVVALAVVDGALVASNDPGADLAAAARAPAGRPATTAGALRATVDAELVKDLLVERLGLPAFARGVLAPLGGMIFTARGEVGVFDAQLVVPVF